MAVTKIMQRPEARPTSRLLVVMRRVPGVVRSLPILALRMPSEFAGIMYAPRMAGWAFWDRTPIEKRR